MSNKILCVRESESLIGKISSYLMQENITVDNEEKAENRMRQLEEGIYSLMTINSSSCSDWISSTVEIRKKSNIPIVIFSNEKNLLDEITAIKIGADEYIAKNEIEPIEIAVRLLSMIRRYTVFSSSASKETLRVKINNLLIDEKSHEVYKNNRRLSLTKTEYKMLFYFAENQGITLTKEQIYENVWNNEYAVGDRNIITHIQRLRNKIEDNPENPQYVHTIRGIGYKFQYQEL